MLIKSVYLSEINKVVWCFDEEGVHLPHLDGKYEFRKEAILAEVSPDAEFYISRWGQGNFEKITREQWEELYEN